MPTDTAFREIRGVWLTLAYALDWPRVKADNYQGIRRQQRELDRILDQLKTDNYNTVFFQVRLSGTSCYLGSQEPFAHFFTSSGAKPKYDPLDYAVKACHKRGLMIHAWFVTYPIKIRKLRSSPLWRKHRSWFVHYKRNYFLNPGLPAVRKYITDLSVDLAKRYDIDGLHYDYFRYPEWIEYFNDDRAYKRYAPRTMSKNEWRRDNLCRQLKEIRQAVHRVKPQLLMSVAPLGKLRQLPNLGFKHGWTAFETVCQDVERWAKESLVDFVVPMMYYKDRLYTPFLHDWQERVGKYIPVVVGLAPYRASDEGWTYKTISQQIKEARDAHASGMVFFRYDFVSPRYDAMYHELKSLFMEKALVPKTFQVQYKLIKNGWEH